MPEIYSDDNGARVITRHRGPAGRGFPAGGTAGQILVKSSNVDYDSAWVNPPDGTDAVNGPATATNNNVAVFDGTTGKLIKDGGQPLSNYASVSLVSTKQDKETGKGLSTNDFTDAYKTKLDSVSANYRGTYISLPNLEASVFDPAPTAGDYALIETVGSPQTVAFWDATNNVWDAKVVEAMTGQEIADVLFDPPDAATWEQINCRIFTDADKALLEEHQSLIDGLRIEDIANYSYGVVSGYRTSTFAPTVFTAVSDHSSNMVPIVIGGTTANTNNRNFDTGEVDTGRLRYTGTQTRKFLINATLSFRSSTLSVATYTAAIAKNGAIILDSRQRADCYQDGGSATLHLTTIAELSENQYLEIFMGITSGGLEEATALSMSITATAL